MPSFRRVAQAATPTKSHTGDENRDESRKDQHRAEKGSKKFDVSLTVRRGVRVPFWPSRCRPTEGAGWLPERTAEAARPREFCAWPEFMTVLEFGEKRHLGSLAFFSLACAVHVVTV